MNEHTRNAINFAMTLFLGFVIGVMWQRYDNGEELKFAGKPFSKEVSVDSTAIHARKECE